MAATVQFLLTRLLRGVTLLISPPLPILLFLLTRLLRGVTGFLIWLAIIPLISTHTPLARRDTNQKTVFHKTVFLLTRLLRGVTSS